MTTKKAERPQKATKTIATNRKAFFDYEILDRFEAGLVLTGTEIKSVRAGKVDLRDAYARVQNGELWLSNAHIALYDAGSVYNHDPKRPRKLLMHREEIDKLRSLIAERGVTLVALSIFIKGHVAKVGLGLARGKRQYDKRRALMDKDMDREARRAMGTVR
ncbi:MAG: SsrA-binding protein [Planctomyces sp.]|nr:SsrA-binding protein [Planctomyces sp.]